MLRFALFGAGRIGRMHAAELAAHPDAELSYIYDVYDSAARETAYKHGAKVAADVATALNDAAVDAVLIASPTDTHVDLITRAARAGKAILCEKPIDLDIDRVNACREEIASCDVPIQIGFNRRYDPSHRSAREAVGNGEVGRVEEVIITSRDPGLAPIEILRTSGGLFRDMMIHDFDMARFILGEEPVELVAMGSVLVDPRVAELDDVDTAMVIMTTASGALCHINCSRRCVYGYDQRVEVFGDKGMVLSANPTATTLERYSASATQAREPLLNFFIERYAQAYRHQLDDFIAAVEQSRTPAVTFEDGRRALILADAAGVALKTGRSVKLEF